MKTCKDCGVSKPLSEYFTNHIKYSSCKQCKNEKSKAWGRNNPDKIKQQSRKTRLKTKYGLTIDQYETMLEQQKGVCYMCEGVNSDRALAVDHCHTTGNVRKLLCTTCNTLIGQAKDNIELLNKAINYLKEHQN
jgi:hypothetical protein